MAGGVERARALGAGVPSTSCRMEGPGAAAPGLPWMCLLPWEGGGVSEARGAWGLQHGVPVRARGGLQPLDLSSQKGKVPPRLSTRVRACDKVTSIGVGGGGGAGMQFSILALPTPGQGPRNSSFQNDTQPVTDPGDLKYGHHISESFKQLIG